MSSRSPGRTPMEVGHGLGRPGPDDPGRVQPGKGIMFSEAPVAMRIRSA